MPAVYLGKSGLKVSKVILGCMTYGGGEWMGWQWLLDEEAAVQHIKYACVCVPSRLPPGHHCLCRWKC